MSSEDTAYLKKVTARQGSQDDDTPLAQIADREQRRDERHRRGQVAAGATLTVPSTSRSKAPAKKSMDWFEFFLSAGCEMDDCTRYATNFQRDRIEEDVLVDLEQSTMRSLGLREGDIIRVTKYIHQKFRPPPTPDKSDRDAQIAADAAMARAMEEGTDSAPGLFTNATGGLKTTRRGRPAPGRQASTLVDSASIATASSELAKLGNSPPISRVPSPPLVNASRSAVSLVSSSGGFDDDAWTVKSPAKSATPPILSPTPPAPAPERTASTEPPAPTLSYNDGLLAQLGIGNRPPPAPTPTQYSQQNLNSFSPAPSPSLLGPRGPVTPIYANQPLLNPLIPTQTGMASFIPTRAPQLMPNVTGYPMGGMGGYASLMPQMTGMLPREFFA